MDDDRAALWLLVDHGDTNVLGAVLRFLPSESLAACLAVCRTLRAAAESPALWRHACLVDWAARYHVSAPATSLLAAGHARAAFAWARADAKRQTLSDEELLALPWRFRFKQAAGDHLVAVDPFWQDGPGSCTRATFLPCGRVERFAPADAPPDAPLTWPAGLPVAWQWARYGPGFSAAAAAPKGALLRHRIQGRGVPTYRVSRDPTTWGWRVQSVWAAYCSWEPQRDAEAAQDVIFAATHAGHAEAAAFQHGPAPLDEDDFAMLTHLPEEGSLEFPVLPEAQAAAHTWTGDNQGRPLSGDGLDDTLAVRVRGSPDMALVPRRFLRAQMAAYRLGVPAAGLSWRQRAGL